VSLLWRYRQDSCWEVRLEKECRHRETIVLAARGVSARGNRASTVLGAVAVALAVVASLWLIFLPAFYQGLSANPNSQETIETSASLIEVNGYQVVFPLLVPVALSLVGFLAARTPEFLSAKRKVAVWALAVTLVVFCVAGLFSIGLFYMPAGAALVAAAVASRQRPRGAKHSVKGMS